MQSGQQHIITSVFEWLSAERPVWLCTILKTWGSSPRPIGSMMACTLDGEIAGSISGGCIEEDFLAQLRDGSLKSQYDIENKPFIVKLLKLVKRPALIELLPERKHYWVLKHEFQVIDSVGGNAQLATVQLDMEDSERYGIRYVDEKGEKKGCIILHSSMGSIERWMYALLEEAAKAQKAGKAPSLPLTW